MTNDPRELLKQAWAANSGDSPLQSMTRMGLQMSAGIRPDLAPTLTALETGYRAELDLHLGGVGVRGHETSAEAFGRFVTRTALAVKELVKSRTQRQSYASRLQVVGPAAGSVRVVFRSPGDGVEGQAGARIGGTEAETVEAEALDSIVALMTRAENRSGEPDLLDPSLYRMQGGARNAVRLLAESILEGSWTVRGELRRADGRRTTVVVSEYGARRLALAAGVTADVVDKDQVSIGSVDGWVWSEQLMTFSPEAGRQFRATVEPNLHRLVAHYVETRERVRATFTRITTYPPGDEQSARHSYELTDIQGLEDDPTLTF